MVKTRSVVGNTDENRNQPPMIERVPVVAAAPEPMTIAKVQTMIQMMLDRQMEETRRLVQQNREEPSMPIEQPELNEGKALSKDSISYVSMFQQNYLYASKPQVQRGKCIKKGQILAYGAAIVGGELALGKNVLIADMPWEGYNFEDAVLINQGSERVTNEIPHLEVHLLRNLDKNGIVMLGSWVETGDILVGKLTPQMVKESSYAPEDRLLRTILGMRVYTSKETRLKLPIGGRGWVIDVRWVQSSKTNETEKTESIRVYILQKREIKVGNKVAGRHGNKGIISKILPRQDMPYLQDGRPVDMVFNPLGVPSRMNVGQIFESSLGLAGVC
ncbi:DNA-directed RNA polymerase subunit beta-like [Lactuca sativa]|uniref:DNA-directed RNA polymerase subunit beta-like n=1 Tax=Lactuca sativa TaxID=4236 RepID=UPI0022AFF71B|nr:DNA-directed RNA polymerase subunit beta-like [Lactuca sativa]